MIKLLFLINTLECGGAENALIELVNSLPNDKYDITVHTIFGCKKYKSHLNNAIHYSYVFRKRKNNLINKLYGIYFCKFININHFYKKRIDKNYDIELAFLEGLPTKILSASNKIKIAFVHTGNFDNIFKLKYFKNVSCSTQIYNNYDKIVCLSDEIKKIMLRVKISSDKLITIHNLVDETVILKKSKEKNDFAFDKTYKNVVAVGRLEPIKAFDRLVKICYKLISEKINFRLYIIGDGSMMQYLKSLTSKLNLTNNIFFLGYQSNPFKYISKSDLYVSVSKAEGFSTTCIESTLLGIPSLVTNCSGMNEIYDYGKYGLIVENDSDSIYKGLKKILTNEDYFNYLKKCAVQNSYRFKKREILEQYVSLFDSLLTKA